MIRFEVTDYSPEKYVVEIILSDEDARTNIKLIPLLMEFLKEVDKDQIVNSDGMLILRDFDSVSFRARIVVKK